MSFNLYIKQYENKEFKLYIKLNNNIKYYSQDFKNLLTSCENFPIKTINDLDPFDFVQSFGKFRKTKNLHAQFTYTMNVILQRIYLDSSPYDYSDYISFDIEFENNIMVRLLPIEYTPNLSDTEFNSFERYIFTTFQ